ncbi:MAG: hypothetical protein GEU93_03835 [Propionibacteriales bacterium]|nr:hypothetical protein [Propionibacteriales bacterium]
MTRVADRNVLDELRDFARLQVRAGYLTEDESRAEVAEAVRAELPDENAPEQVAARWLAECERALEAEQRGWPDTTDFDRLLVAFDDLRMAGIVVLPACEDHWSATAELERLEATGARPHGIVWFTHPDVWHAIDHGMLEINVWHGDSANVAPGDVLLDTVLETLSRHDLPAHFDEGRVEVSVHWQRRLNG